MSKKYKTISLVLLILLFLFSFAKPANAIIGTGLFDFFSAALEGTEEFSSFSTQVFLLIVIFLMITYMALGLSALMLQEIISVPIGLQKSALVLKGWQFVLGLTNLFFALIFIIIAIAFILKIEKIGTKKVLVGLITTALLINFSLLFVGVFVDIATFFQNTILGQDFNLVENTIQSLFGGLGGVITTLTTWCIGFLALYAIPFSAPFAQYAIALRSLTLTLFAPTFLGWVTFIFIGMSVAGIFFTYFFLFACRIFVIWALAIFAPLAFACRILPDTQKWWDKWLKHLSEWASLGIVLLFWLVLGLKMITSLVPTGGPSIMPIIGWLAIDESLKYYMFLFVYLCIGLFIQKEFTPALAGTLMAQGKALGGMLLKRGLYPVGKALQMGAEEFTSLQDQREKEAGKRIKGGETLSRGERIGLSLGGAMASPIRLSYRIRRTSSGAVMTKRMNEIEKDLEKRYGKDYEGLAASFDQFGPMEKAVAIHRLQAIKGAKALNSLKSRQLKSGIRFMRDFQSDWIEDIAKHRPDLIDEDLDRPDGVGNIVRKALVSKGKEDDYVKELMEIGMGEAEAIRKAAMKEVIVSAKRGDIENWSDTMLDDSDIQEAIIKFRGNVNFIRTIGEEKGQQYVQKLHKKYQELMKDENYGISGFMKDNPGLVRSTYKNPALASIFPAIEKIKVDDKYREVKDIKQFETVIKEIQKKPIGGTEMFSPERMSEEFLNLSKAEDGWLEGAKERIGKQINEVDESDKQDRKKQIALGTAIKRAKSRSESPELSEEEKQKEKDLLKSLRLSRTALRKKREKAGGVHSQKRPLREKIRQIEAELTKRGAWKETIEKPSPLPRITKEMPKELKTGIRRQKMYVTNIKKSTERLKTLEKNINILEETGGDAQFIEDRKQELVNTQQSINQLKERLDEIKEEIKPMMEEEKAKQKEEAELRKTKKAYKELKKK